MPTKPVFVGSALVVLGLVAVAAAVPSLLAQHDPLALHPERVLAGPGAGHPLGTDQYGRGILDQLIYGTRARR